MYEVWKHDDTKKKLETHTIYLNDVFFISFSKFLSAAFAGTPSSALAVPFVFASIVY